ncbi:MAG: VCBS repeat-containing protein [Pirellulales bacterium]|nr:VCBS repeat-containing protein [Pirellulales bacterium]
MVHAIVLMAVLEAGQVEFKRHDIDAYPAGYQVAVADVNGDGRPDVLALSTEANRVDWYEAPNWRRHPVAQTARNIDLAVHDMNGDGQVELALAAGFHFDRPDRGGEIYLLRQPAGRDELWLMRRLAVDPVVHRLRWGDFRGDGRKSLVHASIFGPGSDGVRAPTAAHLWAIDVSPGPDGGNASIQRIDEELTVLHGLCVEDLDGDGRDEILTASFEGIFRFDRQGSVDRPRWTKTQIAPGAPPASERPGAPRGTSEVLAGRFADGRMFLAAIEPWHGNQVVVYTCGETADTWRRRVLDDTLEAGHALVVADLDGDATDEIVAGWRGGEGGLRLYDASDDQFSRHRTVAVDRGIAVEGAVAADLNQNGRVDLVAIGGRTNNLVWYENLGR